MSLSAAVAPRERNVPNGTHTHQHPYTLRNLLTAHRRPQRKRSSELLWMCASYLLSTRASPLPPLRNSGRPSAARLGAPPSGGPPPPSEGKASRPMLGAGAGAALLGLAQPTERIKWS
eukprot:scaffold3114_cov114-Isochrysis_galbana.AAC.15